MKKKPINLQEVKKLFSEDKDKVIGFEIPSVPSVQIASKTEEGKMSLGFEVYCYRKQDSKILGKLVINIEDLFTE